jgi:magnesium-transporting ATPase (P-type)
MLKNTWIPKAYSGEAKLWKVFWFGYIGSLFPVTILTNIAKESLVKTPSSNFAFATLLVVGLLYAWLAISMWRCSSNSNHRAYKLLGKLWSIIIGIFVLSAIQLTFQLSRA